MNSQEWFKTGTPNSHVLSEYIAYYYFHESKDENFNKDIIYHPHYLTPLNIYRNVKVEWDDHGRTYFPTKNKATDIILTLRNRNSKEVKLRGAFNKIGIVFRPLGINNFIDQPLSKLVGDHRISYFDYFGDSFLSFVDQVFQEADIQKKIELLDAFFLAHYIPFKEDRIQYAVAKILNDEELPKIQDLANDLKINRKTLLRLFKKHLCFTAEEFKSIVKFRKALAYYKEAKSEPKLIQVAYINNYCDQSDFIGHFKSVTGYNPSSFFSSLEKISKHGTYWTFL